MVKVWIHLITNNKELKHKMNEDSMTELVLGAAIEKAIKEEFGEECNVSVREEWYKDDWERWSGEGLGLNALKNLAECQK